MRCLILLLALLCGWTACSQSSSQAAQSPPIVLQGRVTDAANVIGAGTKRRLGEKLEAYERRTKHQVVVVTAPSLGGKDIAAFTLALANAWGIGRKGFDDGVVILVAPAERKVRIEVGRGLEKTLTDARAGQVIGSIMIPRFQAGEIAAGIEEGADGVMQALDNGERLEAQHVRKSR